MNILNHLSSWSLCYPKELLVQTMWAGPSTIQWRRVRGEMTKHITVG